MVRFRGVLRSRWGRSLLLLLWWRRPCVAVGFAAIACSDRLEPSLDDLLLVIPVRVAVVVPLGFLKLPFQLLLFCESSVDV